MNGAVKAPVTAYIALGSNLGDPSEAVVKAMDDIAAISGVTMIKRSSRYRTAPIESSGPHYVNAVVKVTTVLTAPALLSRLQALEHLAGRARPYPNAPRTLDLDILLYGDARMDSPTLVIPHPRMTVRGFVLYPLAEIAPDIVNAAQLQAVQSQLVERLP